MAWKAMPKRIVQGGEPFARLNKAGGKNRRSGVRLDFNHLCRPFLQPGPVVLLQDETRVAIRAATTDDSAIVTRVLSAQYQVSASQIGEAGQRFRVYPPGKDGIVVLEPIEGG